MNYFDIFSIIAKNVGNLGKKNVLPQALKSFQNCNKSPKSGHTAFEHRNLHVLVTF